MRSLCGAVVLALFGLTAGDARAGRFLDAQLKKPRVAAAMAKRGDFLAAAYKRAGAAWPAQGIFLRAFKLEGVVEVWAPPRKGKRWVQVFSVPVCARSGVLGPKRRVGDSQVPEGFYRIDRFNPVSRFHLSLGVNYPNKVDRKRPGRRAALGGDIFIHGNCVTIGCLPLTDSRIRDVYLAAIHAYDATKVRPSVHIFPCRFGTKRCEKTLAKKSVLKRWWDTLRPGYDAFNKHGIPPRVQDTNKGTYRLFERKTRSGRGGRR